MAPWLQTTVVEAVEVPRLVFVLIAVAVSGFAAGSFRTPPPVIYSHSHSRMTLADINEDDDVDAYGNEVTTAVAEYSFDDAGSLYERHAPQTEVPHLGSPKS